MEPSPQLTPVERSDQRWLGQTTHRQQLLVVPPSNVASPDNRVLIPARAERIELIVWNLRDVPIYVHVDTGADPTDGMPLLRVGDMLVSDVLDDGDITISEWRIYGSRDVFSRVGYIEVWRDIQLDKS